MGIALSPMNYSFHWFKRIKSVKKLLIKILHVKKKNQFGAEGSLGIDYFMPLKNNGSTPFVLNFQRKKKELSTESIPQTPLSYYSTLPSPPLPNINWNEAILAWATALPRPKRLELTADRVEGLERKASKVLRTVKFRTCQYAGHGGMNQSYRFKVLGVKKHSTCLTDGVLKYHPTTMSTSKVRL